MTKIKIKKVTMDKLKKDSKKQPCPKCEFLIGAVAGSKEAICRNCGFKDSCCE